MEIFKIRMTECVCKTMDGECSATSVEAGCLLSGTMYFCL